MLNRQDLDEEAGRDPLPPRTNCHSLHRPTEGGFITVSSSDNKSDEVVWADGTRMNVWSHDAEGMSTDGQEWAEPPLGRHKAVAVQSARCKIATLCTSQRLTKAGGWWLGWECSDTAVSRANTSLLNMGSPHICSIVAPVSARSRDNRGPRPTPFVPDFFKVSF